MSQGRSGRSERSRRDQRTAGEPAQAAHDEVVHQTGIVKAHLVFSGVHVDVHVAGRHNQIQDVTGHVVRAQPVRAAGTNRVPHHGITNGTGIDEEVMRIRSTGFHSRTRHPPPQGESSPVELHPKGVLDKAPPAEPGDAQVALAIGRGGAQAKHLPPVVDEGNIEIRVTQR